MWRRFLAVVAVLVAFGSGVRTGRADDVPEAARKDYVAALDLLAKGDPAKAFSAISKSKDKAPESVDFWVAYVRIWRANGKPEKTLWETIIGKRREANPKCTTFDLVAARLETDPVKRGEAYQAVVAKDPKCLEARVAVARHLLAEGKEDEAEEAIDAVMAEFPDDDASAVGKAEILLGRGQSNAAIEMLEGRLAKKEVPALRRLLAEAFAQKIATDPEYLDRAITAARKSLAGEASPQTALTLGGLLERKGDLAAAVKVLEEQQTKGPSPLVAAMLGDFAFREGRYDVAVKHLAAAAATDLRSARGVAIGEARMGRAAEARAAVAQMLKLDPTQKVTAARVELVLMDGAAARKALEGVDAPEAEFLRAEAMALEAKAADLLAAVGEKASDGTRAGEDWLRVLLEARVAARLGPKAAGFRKALATARAAAAVAGTSPPKVPEQEPFQKANNAGFMQRFVTYRRSLCGTFFAPGDPELYPAILGNKPYLGWAVPGHAECSPDSHRVFPFNMQSIQDLEGGRLSLSLPNEGWEEAEAAFAEGCAALVKETYDVAATAFAKVLEKEPGWARASLFLAAAKASGPTPDLPAAAKLAEEAAKGLSDDLEGRRLAALLRALAGQDVSVDLKALATGFEAWCERRLSEL